MLVAVLIGIMISIVVGVSLIPTILTTIAALPTSTPAGLTALVNVLPYVFVAVILLGAVAWIVLIVRPVLPYRNVGLTTPLIRGKLNIRLMQVNPELAEA